MVDTDILHLAKDIFLRKCTVKVKCRFHIAFGITGYSHFKVESIISSNSEINHTDLQWEAKAQNVEQMEQQFISILTPWTLFVSYKCLVNRSPFFKLVMFKLFCKRQSFGHHGHHIKPTIHMMQCSPKLLFTGSRLMWSFVASFPLRPPYQDRVVPFLGCVLWTATPSLWGQSQNGILIKR